MAVDDDQDLPDEDNVNIEALLAGKIVRPEVDHGLMLKVVSAGQRRQEAGL